MALRLVHEDEILALYESQQALLNRIHGYEEQIRLYREQLERLKESVSFLQNMAALWYRPSWEAIAEGYSGWEYLEFDLSRSRDNELVYASGFGFVVEELSGTAIVRLNRYDSEEINVRKLRAMPAFFERMYVTNDPQPGAVLKLRICKDIRAWYFLAPESRRSYTDYDVITIFNNAPFSDEEYDISGNSLTVMQSSGSWSVKINDVRKPPLYLEKGNVLNIDFERLYISGSGDGGATPIRLYIGKEA